MKSWIDPVVAGSTRWRFDPALERLDPLSRLDIRSRLDRPPVPAAGLDPRADHNRQSHEEGSDRLRSEPLVLIATAVWYSTPRGSTIPPKCAHAKKRTDSPRRDTSVFVFYHPRVPASVLPYLTSLK